MRTPRDMLDKARREHERLTKHIDIDNAFNFLVTAHHIKDYVQLSGLVPEAALKEFALQDEIRLCADLANTAKHLILTKPPRATPPNRIVNNRVGVGKVGEMRIGSSETWLIQCDSRSVEIAAFAKVVIQKWEHFFQQHGI